MALPAYPEMAWSRTKASDLKQCKRRLYFDMFQSWQGWPSGTGDAPSRHAYTLKQVKPLAMLRGTIIHDLIDENLNRIARRTDNVETLTIKALKKFDSAWSDAEKEHWRNHPKQFANIFEVLYQTGASESAERALFEARCHEAFRFLIEDYQFGERLNDYYTRYYIGPDLGLGKVPSMMVEGVKAYVIPDFVGQTKDGRIEIIDWKTGSVYEGDREQIAMYFLFMQHYLQSSDSKFTVGPDKLDGWLVYLKGEGHLISCNPTEEELQALRKKITAGQKELLDLTTGPAQDDPGCVIPKAKSEFEPCLNPKICGRCKYLHLCRGELGLDSKDEACELAKKTVSPGKNEKKQASTDYGSFIDDDGAIQEGSEKSLDDENLDSKKITSRYDADLQPLDALRARLGAGDLQAARGAYCEAYNYVIHKIIEDEIVEIDTREKGFMRETLKVLLLEGRIDRDLYMKALPLHSLRNRITHEMFKPASQELADALPTLSKLYLMLSGRVSD